VNKTTDAIDQTVIHHGDINYVSAIPFILVHIAGIASIFLTGYSHIALFACIFMYAIRMFGITGGYHRYFSHRSYKTSRVFQFLLGFLGCSAAQTGPLWWAAHHRHHHRYSDTEHDTHSPIIHSLFWGHVGWIFSENNFETNYKAVKDLTKYPELVFLNKYYHIAPVMTGVAIWLLGMWMETALPQLGTNRWQMLAWGFLFSTVILYHGTFCINSFAHLIGRRRFPTSDHSKNSFLLAIITLGEGWHNNHHYYQAAAAQGLHWWELDISYYVLKFLSFFGIVWDLKTYPEHMKKWDNNHMSRCLIPKYVDNSFVLPNGSELKNFDSMENKPTTPQANIAQGKELEPESADLVLAMHNETKSQLNQD
jgi:stearoyl-CoA desaturase (delta-9 desaturase)